MSTPRKCIACLYNPNYDGFLLADLFSGIPSRRICAGLCRWGWRCDYVGFGRSKEIADRPEAQGSCLVSVLQQWRWFFACLRCVCIVQSPFCSICEGLWDGCECIFYELMREKRQTPCLACMMELLADTWLQEEGHNLAARRLKESSLQVEQITRWGYGTVQSREIRQRCHCCRHSWQRQPLSTLHALHREICSWEQVPWPLAGSQGSESIFYLWADFWAMTLTAALHHFD